LFDVGGLMRETISITVFDQNDPVTIENVAEAVNEYEALVRPCSSREVLLSVTRRQDVDVVVIGFQKPFEEMFALLRAVKTQAEGAEVVFVSQFDDQALWFWIEAIQRGAYEFLPKPTDPEDLKSVLLRATEKRHPIKLKKLRFANSIKVASLEGYQHRAVAAGN
jgi:DNA-binding NtrC family response regulator